MLVIFTGLLIDARYKHSLNRDLYISERIPYPGSHSGERSFFDPLPERAGEKQLWGGCVYQLDDSDW